MAIQQASFPDYVLFDGEGYFPKYLEHSDLIGSDAGAEYLAKHILDKNELFNSYYYLTKSGMVLAGELDERARSIYVDWRKSCQIMAGFFTDQHLKSATTVEPIWFQECKDLICDVLRPDWPGVEDVKVTATVVPKIHARAVSNTEIHVSVMSREFLRHHNLMLLSEAHEVMRLQQTGTEDPGRTEFIRMTLPFFIYPNDFLSVSALPSMSLPDRSLVYIGLSVTKLQMLFVLAHEFGHIRLGHLGGKGLSLKKRTEFEVAADAFAYETVQKLVDTVISETESELWLATRWLFRIQILDYVVGTMLRGGSIDRDNQLIETRRTELYRFAKPGGGTPQFIGEMGVAVLIALEMKVKDKGRLFLRGVADQLNGMPEARRSYIERQSHDVHTDDQTYFRKWWEEL